MKKKLIFCICCILFCATITFAQTDVTVNKVYKVGIFAPLYLDSAFTGTYYKYGKTFPKFAQPGFDFVQGALIALDSMPLPNGNVQAHVYDSKAYVQNIQWLIGNNKLDSVDIIIGSVKDADYTQLASFAKQKNIPFISATSPSDGGVTNNPFVVILNATLRTHCEGIFSYLLNTHGTDKIYLCRKKGGQEDKMAEYFRSFNEANGKPLLTIETINIDGDYGVIKNKLDSNRTSVFIGASLSEDFANALATTCNDLRTTYPMELIGMPNWESFAGLKKSIIKDLPILYTASFYNAKLDKFSKSIKLAYSKKFKSIPNDLTYKGFESVFIFSRLLTRYPNDMMSHLNEYAYRVFTEYKFKPTFLHKNQQNVPDYFENKQVYLFKILNGKVSKL